MENEPISTHKTLGVVQSILLLTNLGKNPVSLEDLKKKTWIKFGITDSQLREVIHIIYMAGIISQHLKKDESVYYELCAFKTLTMLK
jgi:hypothetical protein